MASSDLRKASNARADLESFFNKPENAVVYGPEGFKKLEDDKLLQAFQVDCFNESLTSSIQIRRCYRKFEPFQSAR